MYKLKDEQKINEKKIIEEIELLAIRNLKNRFLDLNINPIEINSLKKHIIKIKREDDKITKINHLKIFLLNYCSNFVDGDNSPLNIFFRDCGIIFKRNFIQ